MLKLPIKGEGLGAIIKSTTGGVPGAGAKEDTALKKKLRARENEVENLRKEADRLRKTLDKEIPQGKGRELYIETLKERAAQSDGEGNLLDAFHLYRRVLRLDPEDIEALYQVATIYYSAGLKGKAAQILRAILEIDPSQERAAESLESMEDDD
ncbi:MAG: tetratricopeptide repeat protein [Candidatus Nitrospinota bacterium M3_3B_026]